MANFGRFCSLHPRSAIYSLGTWNNSDLPLNAFLFTAPSQVGLSANGAVAIAVAMDTSGGGVQASVYSSGSWSLKTTFVSSCINDFSVGLSADGTRDIVTWTGANGGDKTPYFSYYLSGSWTSAAIPPLLNQSTCLHPQTAISGDGTRIAAVWEQNVSSLNYPYVSLYSPNGFGWVTEALSSAGSQSNTVPQIAMSTDGSKVVVVWETFDGLFYTPHAAIHSSGSWIYNDPPSPVSSVSTEPQVAMSADGAKIFAIWQTYEGGTYTPHAAFYSFSPPYFAEPPTAVKGKRILKGSEYYDKLTWQASPSPNIVKYKIHRGKKNLKLGVVKSTKKYVFITGPVNLDRSIKYKITSINTFGNKSTPAEVKVKKV